MQKTYFLVKDFSFISYNSDPKLIKLNVLFCFRKIELARFSPCLKISQPIFLEISLGTLLTSHPKWSMCMFCFCKRELTTFFPIFKDFRVERACGWMGNWNLDNWVVVVCFCLYLCLLTNKNNIFSGKIDVLPYACRIFLYLFCHHKT